MLNVVDANFLRDSRLQGYLAQSRENYAVFTDYAFMECYKGNALENIRRSIDIVSKYPEQVLVLKGTRKIIGQQANGEHDPCRFVDPLQSRHFRQFCQDIHAATCGKTELLSEVLNRGELANAHLSRVRKDALGVAAGIRQTARSFSSNQSGELRRRNTFSKDTRSVILRNILWLAAHLFRDHPDVHERFPREGDLPSVRLESLCVAPARIPARDGPASAVG